MNCNEFQEGEGAMGHILMESLFQVSGKVSQRIGHLTGIGHLISGCLSLLISKIGILLTLFDSQTLWKE